MAETTAAATADSRVEQRADSKAAQRAGGWVGSMAVAKVAAMVGRRVLLWAIQPVDERVALKVESRVGCLAGSRVMQ